MNRQYLFTDDYSIGDVRWWIMRQLFSIDIAATTDGQRKSKYFPRICDQTVSCKFISKYRALKSHTIGCVKNKIIKVNFRKVKKFNPKFRFDLHELYCRPCKYTVNTIRNTNCAREPIVDMRWTYSMLFINVRRCTESEKIYML